jgi:hypothetical protein
LETEEIEPIYGFKPIAQAEQHPPRAASGFCEKFLHAGRETCRTNVLV